MAVSLDDMKYLEGLTYSPGGNKMTETKAGIPQFAGTASTLQEWKLKVIAKKTALLAIKDPDVRKEKMAELTSEVTYGLADEALKEGLWQLLGEEELAKDDGLAKLIEAVEKHVLTFKEDEARELFHEGRKTEGLLSRQKGETMAWPFISSANLLLQASV